MLLVCRLDASHTAASHLHLLPPSISPSLCFKPTGGAGRQGLMSGGPLLQLQLQQEQQLYANAGGVASPGLYSAPELAWTAAVGGGSVVQAAVRLRLWFTGLIHLYPSCLPSQQPLLPPGQAFVLLAPTLVVVVVQLLLVVVGAALLRAFEAFC